MTATFSILCASVFIMSILSGCKAFAQKYVDVAKLYYNNSANNRFENSDSSTRVKELGVDITVPVVINPTVAILTGFMYEGNQTKLFAEEPEEIFSAIGVRVGLSKRHAEKWTGTYILIPKFASDFEDFSSKDFQLGAIVLMKYTKHTNLSYKVGAYVNREFFGPIIVPLFGLYYLSKNEKFEANLTLPFQVDANYRIHGNLTAGFNFNGLVRSYHLTTIPERDQSGYVEKTANDLFIYLKFNFTNSISIQSRLGYSISRSYRVYDESDKITMGSALVKIGDHRHQLNTDFENGFVCQFSALYRFTQ